MIDSVLGAHHDEHGTTFAVFSRGDAVDLCLAADRDDEGGEGDERRVRLTRGAHDVWYGHVGGVGPGTRYGFRAAGPWDPARGHRFDPSHLLVDPYARAVDGAWSVVVDPAFDWAGDRPPQVLWADTVIYEAHVKGLTRCHPAVPEKLRGTYAGLGHPETIGHLTDLGVTTVELLPIHQAASEPALVRRGATNYWGYNTLAFFAPHAPYAAAGARGGQVGEFKAMVRDLHRSGLEVILDVVYNHTAEGDADGPTLSLRGLDNEAYYRLRHDGSYEDTTGCGNSVDLRHPRALALVTDSLRYWVTEMHVDGFRFDLAPTLARGSGGLEHGSAFLAVVGQDPVLSRVKLIAEPWDLGPQGYQLGSFPPPWAEWNDRFRDAVRTAWLGGRGGTRAPGGAMRGLASRLAGSSDVFAGRDPLASVNFVTAHDGFTLEDVVSYDRKHNDANGEGGRDGTDDNRSWSCGVEGPTSDPEVLTLRRRMARNLLTTLLVATGVPMLTAGDETGRTQGGNNNGYCLDDATTWLSWRHEGWQRDRYDWTRALLALRRSHPVLRHDGFYEGRPAHPDGVKDLAWFGPDGEEVTDHQWYDDGRSVLGMYLAAPVEAEIEARAAGPADAGPVAGPPARARPAESLLVLFNTGRVERAVTLPAAPWAAQYAVLLDTSTEQPQPGPTYQVGKALTLAPHSVQILAARH